MYLLLSQRGPVKVVVSVLCKGWTVSVGTGPKVQPAHGGCEEKRDDTGWLDGPSDQALAPSPHIFVCPSCLSLSCDPVPPAVPVSVLPGTQGTAQGTAWLRQHLRAAGFT